MKDRNGTELTVGTFVSEVGSGGLGCVVMLNVIGDVEGAEVCIVAWQPDVTMPGTNLQTFDPYDLFVERLGDS